MSSLLWKFFLEDDVENFRRVLAEAKYVSPSATSKSHGAITAAASASPGNLFSSIGNASTLGSSPRASAKGRKSSRTSHGLGKGHSQWANILLTKADVNLRDRNGLSILLHAVSMDSSQAREFALALISQPLTDLYMQDAENGWTALHRALYFGNIAVAQALLDADMKDVWGSKSSLGVHHSGGLIRIKDKEGNSPFDLLNATIQPRGLQHSDSERKIFLLPAPKESKEESDVSSDSDSDSLRPREPHVSPNIGGDSVFTFGSNKNMNLGLGDEDDRQFPERVELKRPRHLLSLLEAQKREMKSLGSFENSTDDKAVPNPQASSNQISSFVLQKPHDIMEVCVAKFHTAILTGDPEANLYMCGFGPGGRLGTGDEETRFRFVCIEGGGLSGERITSVGLGQNHTLAVTSNGETYSWGLNNWGQLGYTIPGPTAGDKDAAQLYPRQIFGSIKREYVVGAAASRVHSVLHSSGALYTFGKNEGQLGLVDSDARLQEYQSTPRRVAASLFSSHIASVSAVDHATICLLGNHEVWVFANYGYAKLSFALESFSNYYLSSSFKVSRPRDGSNHVRKIAAGGDTLCALTLLGDVWVVKIKHQNDPEPQSTSTTNPTKIRNALSPPQKIWSPRKLPMAAADVDVGQDGMIVLCTQAGSVWKRVKRTKVKDARSFGAEDSKAKDYKFSRVPGLTRVIAVRSSTFGAHAAVRLECDVTKTQVLIHQATLRHDLTELCPFYDIDAKSYFLESITNLPKLTSEDQRPRRIVDLLSYNMLKHEDVESRLERLVNELISSSTFESYDLEICCAGRSLAIPVHSFMLARGCGTLRAALRMVANENKDIDEEKFSITTGTQGLPRVRLQTSDFLVLVNLVLFTYLEASIEPSSVRKVGGKAAQRARQARIDFNKITTEFGLSNPGSPSISKGFDVALLDPSFFDNADTAIELADSIVRSHSAILCQRSPFFKGMLKGRAAGMWISNKSFETDTGEVDLPAIDLKHIESSTFNIVLRHIYTDFGEQLFDDTSAPTLDEFLDIVFDVLSVANELMLDRLSTICQQVVGRYVNTRNVCQLLNAVASCSMTDLKMACLEFLCLNLEEMLENHLLEELEEDLLLELDEVVRANQLDCLPRGRSRAFEAHLQEKYPDIVEEQQMERQDKIRALEIRSKLVDHTSLDAQRAQGASTEAPTPNQSSKNLRRSSANQASSQTSSPALKAKASATELIFDMDEDVSKIAKPRSSSGLDTTHSSDWLPATPTGQREILGRTPQTISESVSESEDGQSSMAAQSVSPSPHLRFAQDSNRPSSKTDNGPSAWIQSQRSMSSSKLSMKEIMAQASSNRASNLSHNLSMQSLAQEKSKTPQGKISQKERKRIQQEGVQQDQSLKSPSPVIPRQPASEDMAQASPWQKLPSQAKVSLREVIDTKPKENNFDRQSEQNRPENVKGNEKADVPQPPAERPRPKPRSTYEQARTLTEIRKSPGMLPTASPRSYANAKAEASLQLSMSDIISQQQTEQQVIKEAVAKRPLQEIQQEQKFMEWWDAESKKTLAEEERGKGRQSRSQGESSRGRGRGKTRGKSRSRGSGATEGANSQDKTPARASSGRGNGRVGHGSGRGGK